MKIDRKLVTGALRRALFATLDTQGLKKVEQEMCSLLDVDHVSIDDPNDEEAEYLFDITMSRKENFDFTV